MGSHSIPSLFSQLEDIPLDPHYSLKEDFTADSSPTKVILGSGIYRDKNGKPWVLPAVKEVSQRLKHVYASSFRSGLNTHFQRPKT